MLFLLAERSRRVLTRSISACACESAVLFQERSLKKKQTEAVLRFIIGARGFGIACGGDPIITSRELYHANNGINSVTIDLLQLTSILFTREYLAPAACIYSPVII